MPNYRRAFRPGGTYFFTLALLKRKENDLLICYVHVLRQSISRVKQRHPFKIHAWVVLPDHLHCVIELPAGDNNFPLRWRLIKSGFSRGIPQQENISTSRLRRTERGVWQRRYWEHLIRDEQDYSSHMDYVHINPLKHGLVQRVSDWPISTFHKLVAAGIYSEEWGGLVDKSDLNYGE